MTRYFSGRPSDMGTVEALPQDTFEKLCEEVLSELIPLPLSKPAFFSLEKKERNTAKRVQYMVPATFGSSPSARTTDKALRCNLLALDVDDTEDAKRVLVDGGAPLGDLGYAIWHTASSTPEEPRLRVLVSAEAIPLSRYSAAVRTVAEILGLRKVSRESLVPVQPMYLPVSFRDLDDSPFVDKNAKGEAFTALDILADDEMSTTSDGPIDTEVGDLEYLKAPMEGITLGDMEEALDRLDPDMAMQDWVEVGMALKHQFGDEGLSLWDKWSAKGKKYDGSEATEVRWQSFKAHPTNRNPITIRSVVRQATTLGWRSDKVSARTRAQLQAWITDEGRSTEELMDQAPLRIARVKPLLSLLERKALMATLKKMLASRNMSVCLPDISKEVKRQEMELSQKTGAADWTKGMCYVTSMNIFYKIATDRKFKPEVVDLMFAVPSTGEDATPLSPKNYLIQVAKVPQVENLRYEPKLRDKKYFSEDGVPYVNTYRPPSVTSDSERAQEAGELFHGHVKNLIAEPAYQQIVIDFLAYMVQHPGAKIRWAIILQGAQGAGKTFFAEAMSAVMGRRNVMKVAANSILTGTYNDWAYGHQLVVLDEIRVVGQNRYAVMDKLKTCVADDFIPLNVKFEHMRTVPNVSNYLMFTNYHDALAIQDEDRRYFVIKSRLQRKAQIEELGPGYFEKLFGMLTDNPGGLKSWLENWPISDSFKPEGRAPSTTYMAELVEDSASPLVAAVRQALRDDSHPLVRPDLVSVQSLRAVVETMPGLHAFTDHAIAGVLRDMGWLKSERWMHEGTRHQLWSHGDIKIANPRKTAQDRMEVL